MAPYLGQRRVKGVRHGHTGKQEILLMPPSVPVAVARCLVKSNGGFLAVVLNAKGRHGGRLDMNDTTKDTRVYLDINKRKLR